MGAKKKTQSWTLQLSVHCEAFSAIGHGTLPEGTCRRHGGE